MKSTTAKLLLKGVGLYNFLRALGGRGRGGLISGGGIPSGMKK